jgi:hypothetical protein
MDREKAEERAETDGIEVVANTRAEETDTRAEETDTRAEETDMRAEETDMRAGAKLTIGPSNMGLPSTTDERVGAKDVVSAAEVSREGGEVVLMFVAMAPAEVEGAEAGAPRRRSMRPLQQRLLLPKKTLPRRLERLPRLTRKGSSWHRGEVRSKRAR